MDAVTRGWDEGMSVVDSVLRPDDGDLPILSSLVGSPRWNGSTSGVAPHPVPLDSLQSLPVASRML
ncbi:MAG TPA: hypothetical protein VJT31_33695 [Rugosimonospora sp.]|nr:hypothetical protein [Rugosimonospora sp.]